MAHTAHETRQPALVGAAIFSTNPQRLVEFYEAVAGVSFTHRVHDDGREHFIADLGAVHVEVKALTQADGTPTPDAIAGTPADGAGRIELSFTVDDAAAAFAHALDLGAQPHEAPVSFSWGTFGTVTDPDGNRLGLFTPPSSTRGDTL